MGIISKRFVLKNEIFEIPVLSSTVEQFCKENGFSGELAQDLRLVLEEIFSNIVFYSFDDQEEHQILFHFSLSDNLLTLEIEDDGKPFNLLEHGPQNGEIPLEERQMGGMGIQMVRELVDEIEYFRKQNKNIIVLRKNILT